MIQRMFVTIDTKKTNYKNVGKINHGDDLILELTVLSDGDMISFNNPMVDLLVKKSDGKMIRQNSGIEHIKPNKFIIEVSKDCVTSPGLSTNQLIINDNGRISTCMFYYTILSSLEEDIIESVSNVEVLEQLDEFTIQMKDKMENFDNELQNRMSELKNDIDDLVESFGATSVELQEAELSRNEAEQTRAQAESVRVQNESRRLQNDLDLANAEAERVRAENVRIQNESDRALVYAVMDQKESEREDSELERIQNESKRATNETVRQQNENTRQSNESIRMSNETDRKTQENRRVTAETNRVNAETTRRNNENSRISNEIERQKAMNEMKSLIDEANGFDERVCVVENEIVEINSSLEHIANLNINVISPPIGLTPAKGDGVTNDTDAINAIVQYVKSLGGGTITIPNGVYMIETAISNTVEKGIIVDGDNIHIELSDGAILKAIPNKYPKYSIVTFKDMKNGSIKGGKILGDRKEHDYTSISGTHEFGFGVHIYSAENITVEKCYISDLTGDCIEIWGRNNPANGYAPSKFVTIKNCSLNMSRRNNISVVVGTDITISENIISNAGESDGVNEGTNPKSGIDIEGGSNPRRINVVNNIFVNNLGGSIIVFNGNEVNVSGNICDQTIMYQYSSNINISNNILRNFNETKRAGIEQTITSISPNTKGYMVPIGCKYQINSQQTFDFTTIGSPSNEVGTVFVTTDTGILGEGDSITRVLENIVIIGNQVSGFANGIATKGCTKKISILNNTLSSQAINGIYSTGSCDIINNSLYNQAIGIRCSGNDINVIGNTVDTCVNRAIYCLDNGSGIVDGNSIINFKHNINGAIEVATGSWELKNNTIKCNEANIGITVASENCLVSNNLITGTYNLACIRLTKKSTVVNNLLENCNTSNGIYCTSANGSESKVYRNSLNITKTKAKGIVFSGDGTGVVIMDNIIQATNVTIDKAIDTSSNTNSKLINNTILSGQINKNSSDIDNGNVVI